MPEDVIESIPNYRRLSERVGTGGQPTPEQVAALGSAGYEVLVNLRPAADTPPEEAALARAQGMTYVHIPVIWADPRVEDAEQFFAAMEQHRERRVFVHCAVNYRVSAFMYLYRVLKEEMAVEAARGDLLDVWTPDERWQLFLDEVMRQRSQ